jgi:hypothetical protein
MKGKMFLRTGMVIIMVAALVGLAISAAAQDKPADNMQILREKVKADKKLNQRIGNLIKSYAADYRTNTLTDEKAKKLIDELVAIEQAEAGLKTSYVPKLSKVLPLKKVARYLQIENKVRAIAKYELADNIPLVR